MVNTQTPAQLAQICSIADIPVPTRLSKMVTRGQSRSETRASSRAKSSDHVAMASNTTSMRRDIYNERHQHKHKANPHFCHRANAYVVHCINVIDLDLDLHTINLNIFCFSKVNINEMFSTLPKSLTMELAVVSKINKNQDEIEKRRTLCQVGEIESWKCSKEGL